MKIELTSHSSNIVIVISGEIDMHSSPELRARLLELIDKKPPVLLIDFTSVSYIDSSGIATFVEALKHMKSYGGKLHLCGLPAGIREIFGFSKLDKVFEIFGNIDDAIGR